MCPADIGPSSSGMAPAVPPDLRQGLGSCSGQLFGVGAGVASQRMVAISKRPSTQGRGLAPPLSGCTAERRPLKLRFPEAVVRQRAKPTRSSLTNRPTADIDRRNDERRQRQAPLLHFFRSGASGNWVVNLVVDKTMSLE